MRETYVDSFEKLEVFQRSYKLSLDIHKFCVKLPKTEQRFLGDQMQRASKSICANIAEGFGKQRQSKAEFRRFLLIALGSSDEMRVWLRYTLDLGYLDKSIWQKWRDEYQAISKMLQSLCSQISK